MNSSAGREAWRTIFQLIFEGEAHSRLTEAAAAVELSPGLLKTLFHLQPGEGMPMRDLADHWRCDASYVTSLADALEQRGLAERRAHPTDRRVRMVVLTEKGVAARKRAFELIYQPPRSFGALTAAEQRQLRDLLRKVADAEAEPLGRAAVAR
ncbi:MAG TPA: MarR family transcriptional regulator [Actinomycetota bacterium]|nr:MarR family transcriptional regulator [Actinomycetota bacterium]